MINSATSEKFSEDSINACKCCPDINVITSFITGSIFATALFIISWNETCNIQEWQERTVVETCLLKLCCYQYSLKV